MGEGEALDEEVGNPDLVEALPHLLGELQLLKVAASSLAQVVLENVLPRRFDRRR